jgi:tetratricopeptide (TPR) repeat protein
LWLAGCATLDPAPAPVAVPETPPGESVDLPPVALDEATLYNLLIGEIAGQRGQAVVAAETLADVARQTRDPRLAERATLAAIYAKRYDEALVSAKLWVELRPTSIEAREALAAVLLELKRPAEAKTEFQQLLALDAARRNLDQAYMRTAALLGRYPERAVALETMQSLVSLNPRVPAAHFAAAHLAVRAGELDRALLAADTALQLKPSWEEAALLKARILVSQKEPARAQEFYEAFLAEYPAAVTMRLGYARYLIDLKQWDKARVQFERVVSDNPADADAVYALGLLSLQTGRPEDAEKHLLRVLHLRPDHDQARLYLGQVAENRKRYEEAAKWYGEITSAESYFEAQTRLAVVLARQGNLDAARARLRAIPIENDQQRAQVALAEEQVLRDARRFQEAYDVLSAAVAKLPDNNDLLYARALTAEKLNRLEVVESDLKLVIRRDPKNAHALNALGYTLADRTTRFQEAQEYLTQALQLRPDDPFILDSFGWLHYRMGNVPEALRHLKRALELRSDAEIAAHLGEVLWVSGQQREAESVWSRALKETPDSDALLDVIKKYKP